MDDICEEGWHRGFEGDYEIHVRSRPAVTNDSERNAAFGYDVKILPPGAEPASPAAWVEFSSGEGIQFRQRAKRSMLALRRLGSEYLGNSVNPIYRPNPAPGRGRQTDTGQLRRLCSGQQGRTDRR